jgi:hypothetical protein
MVGTKNFTNDFIQKSIQKFGNRYKYLSEYKSIHELIKLKCKDHNTVFDISARNHLRSDTGSCPKCKEKNMKNIKSVEESYFFDKSKIIFGKQFDYSKVNYKNKKEKIVLICKKHNFEFTIKPISHYKSPYGGCKNCINVSKNKKILKIIKKESYNLFDFSNIQLELTKNTIQTIKCNNCKGNINICLAKFNGVCLGCSKIEKDKRKETKEKLLKIGKKIENIVQMRKSFKPDEYIKKINIDDIENYYVSNYGKVFNKDKKELNGHINLQGYVFVRLYLYGKSSLYRVHRLVCSTFNYNNIENKNIVDHINRIRHDNRASNLRWVTQKENMGNKSDKVTNKNYDLIEKYNNLDKNDEKFRIIKVSSYGNLSNYSISNYGKIKNNKTKQILKPYITDEGYIHILLNLNGNRKNIPIHRLVCEIFNSKKDDKYNDKFVVNHINEIKHDNYYKNLEWCTVKKNNRHSKCIKINMLDDNKNIIKAFPSYTKAYHFLKLKNSGCIKTQMDKERKAYGYYWSLG